MTPALASAVFIFLVILVVSALAFLIEKYRIAKKSSEQWEKNYKLKAQAYATLYRQHYGYEYDGSF